MAQIVYDANNWLRRRFEGGASIRVCFAEVKMHPGAVVFDGARANERRRQIYPGYKVGRTPMVTSMFEQIKLFRDLMKFLPSPVVFVPEYEADDVIATLVRAEGGAPIHIKSNDADFMQLPNVSLDRETPFAVPGEWVRTYKGAVGDPSDRIPGIKGFGKKSWADLSLVAKGQLRNFLEGKCDELPTELSKACTNWLSDPANAATARSYYQITGFYDVPMDLILAHTSIGQLDPAGAEELFARFRL